MAETFYAIPPASESMQTTICGGTETNAEIMADLAPFIEAAQRIALDDPTDGR